MSEDIKRLYRSRRDRWIFGVCGGIGEYFNLDPVLIRVLFVIFTLIFGSGILLYLLMWLLKIVWAQAEGSRAETPTVPAQTHANMDWFALCSLRAWSAVRQASSRPVRHEPRSMPLRGRPVSGSTLRL